MSEDNEVDAARSALIKLRQKLQEDEEAEKRRKQLKADNVARHINENAWRIAKEMHRSDNAPAFIRFGELFRTDPEKAKVSADANALWSHGGRWYKLNTMGNNALPASERGAYLQALGEAYLNLLPGV